MKLKFLFITLSLFTFFFGFLFPKIALADTFTLSGRVSDNANNSIVGATIDVIDPSNNTTVASALTDLGGNYITIVNGGTYNVQVTPPAGSNFSPAIALSQNVSGDKVLNFSLVPAGTVILSGHIYDPFGTPLENQKVSIGSIDSVTDANGYYSLQVSPGTHQINIISKIPNNDLSLKAPQMYNVAFSYPVNQSITDLDITLPAKKVDIHVQDASSTPVQNVEIRTSRASSSINLSIGGGTTVNASVYSAAGLNIFGGQIPCPATDQFGNATLWLFNGTFDITATPPSGSSYLSKTISNFNVSSNTQGTIELVQPVTLSGHIYDPFGTPLENQKVSIGSIDSVTDANGYYSLQVSPGTHQINIISKIPNNDLSLKAPQLYNLAFSYSITQNTTLDITIPAKKVDIHVQDASNNPVRDVEIRTSRTSTSVVLPINGGTSVGGYSAYGLSIFGSPVTGPKTDDSGNVTLWLLPGSPFTITATPPSGSNYLQTTLFNIAISSDTQTTVILEDQPVTLSGHIYDYLGNPLANHKVQLSATGLSTVDTFTDADGSYSMQAAPHAYNIQIAANNSLTVNAPQMYNISFDYQISQNTVLDVTIPAKKVDVHVQDASNSPVSDVEISTSRGFGSVSIPVGGVNINANVYSAAGLNLSGISVPGPKTDESGNATLLLLPGEFTMNANPPSESIYSSFTLNNVVITNAETEIISLQYNHATPITTIDLQTQNPDQTYSDPATVTLSATAAEGYTVSNTYYKLDRGSPQIYTAPFAVSGTGEHTVEYWSVDNSGVEETHQTKTFTIHVNNHPSVDPFPGASLNEGDAFTQSSFFTDPDSASWTATIDYDDGAGPEPLTLSPDKTFSLNHQYKDNGTFTVTVVVRDNQQATGTTMATVTVNNAAPSVGAINLSINPVHTNSSTTASASFTDSGVLDTHTAVWDWGDTTTGTGAVTEENGSGSVSDTHTYTQAGIYTIKLTIIDKDGGEDTKTTTSYVVVYDPSGGFITGSGHIESPAEAYASNTEASGEIKFGVQAKYKGNTPEGKTKFNFKEADLDFESTSYEWYVITGNKAQLKGTGAINGSGNYNFLLTAIDTGEPEGKRTDTLRMKITDANGAIIYDNQTEASDTTGPTTAITNGSIKIHK